MTKTLEQILNQHPTNIKYIEGRTGKALDLERVVELGLEALKSEVKRKSAREVFNEHNAKRQKDSDRPTLYKVINDNAGKVKSWEELEKKASKHSYDISIISKLAGDMAIGSTSKYFYKNQWLRSQTNGRFGINYDGTIVEG